MTADQDTRNSDRSLPRGMIKLTGAINWEKYKLKLLAVTSDMKIDHIFTMPDPRNVQDGQPGYRQRIPLTENEINLERTRLLAQAQLQLNQAWILNPMAVGAPPLADPRLLPDISMNTRLENNSEIVARCAKYVDDNGRLWSLFVASTDDGPCTVVRLVAPKDGISAYRRLTAKYATVNNSTVVGLIKKCFDMSQTGDINDHVTAWCEMMRKLDAADVHLPPKLEAVMFLRTLKGVYKGFHDAKMMANVDLDPDAMYREAVSYSESCINATDEHNSHTTLNAMWASSGSGKTDSRAPWGECYKGFACQRPGCKFTHPPGFKPKPQQTSTGACPRYGADCRLFSRNGSCPHTTAGKPPKSDGWKVKNHQNHNKSRASGQKWKQKYDAQAAQLKKLKTNQKEALAAMATEGRTDSSQQFGLADAAICEALGAMEVTDADDSVVAWKFDTGANDHFSGLQVPTTDHVPDSSVVRVADGNTIDIHHKGIFEGEATDGTDNVLAFPVKQSSGFAMNLFSGFRAVKDGCRVVLDEDESYLIHKATGTRFPLVMTATGWDILLKPPVNTADGALDD